MRTLSQIILLIFVLPMMASAIGSATKTLKLPGFTASRVLVSDSNSELGEAATTTTELSQLETIDSTTISAAQWGYLGGLDQSLTTADAVQFGSVNLTGLTASKALIVDGSNNVTTSVTTSTELSYVNGVTSAIQTQIDTKLTEPGSLADGDILYYNSSAWNRLAKGTDGEALVLASGLPSWGVAGIGVGDFSYFPDYEADNSALFVAYDDVSAATDLTGGSPNITCDDETTEALSPDSGQSYELQKDAADRQHEGCYIASDTLSRLETTGGQPVIIKFNYETSANYADDDIEVYVYRVGDNDLLKCYGRSSIDNTFNNTLPAAPDGGTFSCVVNFTSSSTDFRLGFHIASTNASAYDVRVDRITAGPDKQIPVPIQSDWQACTMTIDGSTSAPTKGSSLTTDTCSYRRVGSDMILNYTYEDDSGAGSADGSGNYLFTIPNGLTIDPAGVDIDTQTLGLGNVGTASCYDGSSGFAGFAKAYNSNSLTLIVMNATASQAVVGSSRCDLGHASERRISFSAIVPILEWKTPALLSGRQQDNYNVSAKVYLASNQSVTNGTTPIQILFDTVEFDTHNLYDTASDHFKIKSKGKYFVMAQAEYESYATGGHIYCSFFINDTQYKRFLFHRDATNIQSACQVQAIMDLDVDDEVEFRSYHSRGSPANALGATDGRNSMEIHKIPDFTTFAAQFSTPDVQWYGDSPTGHGSTNTKVRTGYTERKNTLGVYGTYADDSTNGASITVNVAGTWSCQYSDREASAAETVCITLNGSAFTTNCSALTYAQGMRAHNTSFSNNAGQASYTSHFSVGDIIRPQDDGGSDNTDARSIFSCSYLGP